MIDLRIGHGYDVHRLVEGRPLILGGVTIPYERGLLGHSDADVLAHAVMDALLGAAALGDIGGMFPDSDERWRDADSLRLLEQVAARLATWTPRCWPRPRSWLPTSRRCGGGWQTLWASMRRRCPLRPPPRSILASPARGRAWPATRWHYWGKCDT